MVPKLQKSKILCMDFIHRVLEYFSDVALKFRPVSSGPQYSFRRLSLLMKIWFFIIDTMLTPVENEKFSGLCWSC